MTTNTEPETVQELVAFLESLEATAPQAMTACLGWTAHELVAHLAAGSAEVAAALEAFAEGRPVPPTRSMAERETPYRDMADGELRRALIRAGDRRAAAHAAAIEAGGPAAEIPWTGRRMPIAAFATHARSELALHRWDLVGEDEIGLGLLSQPVLTSHAVSALGRVLPARGAATHPSPLRIVLRAPGAADVLLVADESGARLQVGDGDTEAPSVISDPAARLLLLWGRRPQPPSRVHVPAGSEVLARAQAVLAGY